MAANEETQDAGLAETIEVLRGELRKAADAGRGSDVRFAVGSVEVELAIEVVKKAGAGLSINVLNVLSISGQGERSKSDSNRVKVTLQPIGPNGEPIKVATALAARPDGRPDGR